MFRPLPFNLKENAEKGQEILGKVLETVVEHSFNPLDKVGGMLFPFRVDVIDCENRYELFAELPGFSKESIEVSYHEDSRLKIKAARDASDFAISSLTTSMRRACPFPTRRAFCTLSCRNLRFRPLAVSLRFSKFFEVGKELSGRAVYGRRSGLGAF